MKHFQKIIAVVVVVLAWACDPDVEKTNWSADKEYLPLVTGSYLLYDIEEIVYTLGTPETLAYELKTVVADSFRNQAGNYSYIIHRSTRSPGEEWINENTWTAELTRTEAIIQEGNIPYVALSFPLTDDKTWNGNRYNNQVNPGTNTPEDVYKLVERKESFTINGKTFNDCVIIEQEDNQEFFVFFDKRIDVYSRGIGLVYREKSQLEYCTDEARNCFGSQIVDAGIIYRQQLREYGKN